MKIMAKAIAIAALMMMVSQAAFAHDHHDRNYRDWNNGNYNRNYNHNWRSRNQVYYPSNYHRVNGSYIDTSVGPDGYPAFMGGYRPR